MALTHCTSCEQMISDKAKICPKCHAAQGNLLHKNAGDAIALIGQKIKKNSAQNKHWKYALTGIIICVCLGGAYLIYANRSPQSKITPAGTNQRSESKVDKAIRIVKSNQEHFVMFDDVRLTDFFEERQRENAEYDPNTTINGFTWSGEALEDNTDKIKVEYSSYPTKITLRWYWLVNLQEQKIYLMDSEQDGYAMTTLSFDASGKVLAPSTSNAESIDLDIELPELNLDSHTDSDNENHQVNTDTHLSDSASTNSDLIHGVIQKWQDIKRQAFVNGDTSGLSSVLTGKALSDTEGGVKWWQSNGEYHSITLNSLDFLDTQVNGSSASVRVRISETKHNSVEGNKTSTYNATYGLEKRGDNWYISSVAAD